MSIRLKLTLWYSTILAATLLLFGVAVYFISSYILLNDQKHQMIDVSREFGPVKPRFMVGGTLVIAMPQLDAFKYSEYFIQARDNEGNVLGTSRDFSLPISFSSENQREHFTIENISGRRLLVYHFPTPIQGTEQTVLMQIAVIIDDIEAILKTLKFVLFILSVITILLAATLGWYLARKALRPIDKVIAAAAQIEKGEDLGVRIDYNGPHDEIGRLTETINGMLGRIHNAYGELEESDRAQRRFVSDASHELRTPLTTIRGNVELLEKMWRQTGDRQALALEDPEKIQMSLEAMQDIAGEASRMSRLVNDLLALARADAGHEMAKEPMLILPIVEDAARKATHLPRTAEWQVGDISALHGVGVTGNRDYLQQLMFIFIENAFKYTPDGHIRLDAADSANGNQIAIRISDTGLGMDKEEVPHIFERFYRADVSRGRTSGTGLGLSIAKWIIDEHGGSIEVTTKKDAGTTFIIWLPVSFREAEE